MGSSWLWNVNKTEEEAKAILKDPEEKRFVHYAALLLSRHRGLPKEIFKEYLSKENFCRRWLEIKRKMRKDNWNDQRIPFWDEIYKRLIADFKKKGIEFRSPKKELPKNPGWQRLALDIRNRRRAQKITQAEFAEKMGVTQQFISKIEGGTQNLSVSTIEKIESVLGRVRSFGAYQAVERHFSSCSISEPGTTWIPSDPGYENRG
jgi:DNA-binding XRE family transcriptional regulator